MNSNRNPEQDDEAPRRNDERLKTSTSKMRNAFALSQKSSRKQSLITSEVMEDKEIITSSQKSSTKESPQGSQKGSRRGSFATFVKKVGEKLGFSDASDTSIEKTESEILQEHIDTTKKIFQLQLGTTEISEYYKILNMQRITLASFFPIQKIYEISQLTKEITKSGTILSEDEKFFHETFFAFITIYNLLKQIKAVHEYSSAKHPDKKIKESLNKLLEEYKEKLDQLEKNEEAEAELRNYKKYKREIEEINDIKKTKSNNLKKSQELNTETQALTEKMKKIEDHLEIKRITNSKIQSIEKEITEKTKKTSLSKTSREALFCLEKNLSNEELFEGTKQLLELDKEDLNKLLPPLLELDKKDLNKLLPPYDLEKIQTIQEMMFIFLKIFENSNKFPDRFNKLDRLTADLNDCTRKITESFKLKDWISSQLLENFQFPVPIVGTEDFSQKIPEDKIYIKIEEPKKDKKGNYILQPHLECHVWHGQEKPFSFKIENTSEDYQLILDNINSIRTDSITVEIKNRLNSQFFAHYLLSHYFDPNPEKIRQDTPNLISKYNQFFINILDQLREKTLNRATEATLESKEEGPKIRH